FVSTRSGSYNVFVMNIDGSNVRQMTDSDERDDYPTWHPNGQQIVCVSERDGDFDLCLMDVSDGKLALGE
nr:PD40 domain-containing protein [Planctomycetota bacterium]